MARAPPCLARQGARRRQMQEGMDEDGEGAPDEGTRTGSALGPLDGYALPPFFLNLFGTRSMASSSSSSSSDGYNMARPLDAHHPARVQRGTDVMDPLDAAVDKAGLLPRCQQEAVPRRAKKRKASDAVFEEAVPENAEKGHDAGRGGRQGSPNFIKLVGEGLPLRNTHAGAQPTTRAPQQAA